MVKKAISVLLVLIIVISLCACGGGKEPSALEKARAEAKASREALVAIEKAAGEAKDRLDQSTDYINSLFGG